MTVVTALGPLRIEYTSHGICGLHLGKSSRDHSNPPAFVRQCAAELQRYAEGQPVNFTAPLDLRTGTIFQRKIWELLCQIPHGETRSYSWLAEQAGHPRAVRAVGGACGANPVPVLIPCHRIRRRSGALGGFSAGLSWKKRLLAREGVTF